MLALLKSDARRIPLADDSVQCVVTSPPYWGLRKYSGEQELVWGQKNGCRHEWGTELRLDKQHQWKPGHGGLQDNQVRANAHDRTNGCFCYGCGVWRGAYGLEPTVEMYVQHTVEILREIRRVLRDDGVVFWNIGDSYASSTKGSGGTGKSTFGPNRDLQNIQFQKFNPQRFDMDGLKPKDLCLIPFRVALAAQADGWWVRSDIIWAKPNPMPESVTDRPTRSHEYILMLTKSAKYYWDAEAVAEPSSENSHGSPNINPGQKQMLMGHSSGATTLGKWPPIGGASQRNLRSVWTFATEPYPEAHFATFPEELPRRCILAATRLGDVVLDPFAGSGTVGKVAIELGRRAILCDLAYQDLASKRTAAIQRPLLEVQL